MPYIFGPSVSFAGKFLTGIDPTKLSPAFALNKNQKYQLKKNMNWSMWLIP